jgi:Oxidoreductase family, NAD-binding Rossmann fold
MTSTRRDLFKLASFAAAGMAAEPQAASVAGMAFERKSKVRVGFVGLGGRGMGQLQNFSAAEGVEVTALCDIVKDKVLRAKQRLEKAGQQTPAALYDGSERAFEELCKRDDIDVVVNATSWDFHVPVAVFGMKQGKHVAVEVPAASTLEECWALVNASEQTRRHCVMLENCCYGYNEMLVLNLVRDGVLGDLTHGAAAYDHDLRTVLFSKQGEGLWRRAEHFKRNGNLYPTHGLGPVARYMDINRGDRFEYLVSMSSPALSLAAYRDSKLPADDPRRKETYRCGDQNTSLIKTAKGRIITLEHNVSSPEPYDRINLIAGTKGIFRDYPPRIYVDGAGRDEWSTIDSFKAKYEDKYWSRMGEIARKLGGHGGMDFIQAYRLIECVQKGIAPDMDVYDAAAWCAPAPLSEMSVAKGSAPIPFPDFTRGKWQQARS